MHLTGMGAELRQTIRSLTRRPARTALVVVTLAAGIAATTTIYSVVDAVIVRPLPYARSEHLVTMGMLFPDREWRADAPGLQRLAGTSVATMVDWRERTHSFKTIEAVEQRSGLMSDTGNGPELVPMATVTPGFLDLIGARMELGRSLQGADFEEGASAVALLAHHTWVQRYGADPNIVGRVEAGMSIVGVLAAGLVEPEAIFASSPEFWTPLSTKGKRYADRGRRSVSVIGLLAEGVTLEAARADLASTQAVLADTIPAGNVFPDGNRFGAGANLLHAQTIGAAARPLSIFFGGAAILLLIATMNSANLLLLRSLEREGEATLRRALGATRSRLVAGLLLEGLILAAAGGAVGVLLANFGVAAFLQVGPASIPRLAEVSLNPRVLAISAVVSLCTGLLAALLPALRLASRQNLGTGLRAISSPSVTSSGHRLRTSLVIVQLAAAMVLGIGASLLMNALLHVSASNLGFLPDNLMAMTVPMKRPGAESVPASVSWDRALAEVSQVAGVENVAAGSDAPFMEPSWAPWVWMPGDLPDTRREGVMGFVVTPGFFDTIGTPLQLGRDFGPADSIDSEPVVIVNEAFVSANLGSRDPIGAEARANADDGQTRSFRVVGVVANVVQRRAEDAVPPSLYRPHGQEPWPYGINVLVRSTRTGPAYNDELRQAVSRFSPAVPITAMYPLSSRMDSTLAEPTFRAAMFASFAAVSALLAIIGLYGSLSHAVGRRTRELGLRMALGADRRSVFSLVLKQGAMVAAAGLAVGLAGAALLARSLQSFLYGTSPLDPMTFVAAAVTLGGIALLAALSPARRAARVDLTTSLRE